MTTEFVSLWDEESGRTLGVPLTSLGRKNGLVWRQQQQQALPPNLFKQRTDDIKGYTPLNNHKIVMGRRSVIDALTLSTPNCIKLLLNTALLALLLLLLCSSIGLRIVFTVKRCASAQKPWIVAGWVWVSGWVGCYWAHTTTPPTTNISLLSHARQRNNVVLRWVGGCAVGGCNTKIIN